MLAQLYDELASPIAKLVLLRDMSMQCPPNNEILLHSDDLAQVLSQLVDQLRATQKRIG